jgi:hypothetical protein
MLPTSRVSPSRSMWSARPKLWMISALGIGSHQTVRVRQLDTAPLPEQHLQPDLDGAGQVGRVGDPLVLESAEAEVVRASRPQLLPYPQGVSGRSPVHGSSSLRSTAAEPPPRQPVPEPFLALSLPMTVRSMVGQTPHSDRCIA